MNVILAMWELKKEDAYSMEMMLNYRNKQDFQKIRKNNAIKWDSTQYHKVIEEFQEIFVPLIQEVELI